MNRIHIIVSLILCLREKRKKHQPESPVHMYKSLNISSVVFSLILAWISISCQKDKERFTISETHRDSTVYSSLRIVNLGSYRHVIADGDTLTSMIDGTSTEYFEKGYMQDIWRIPQGIFKSASSVKLGLTGINYPQGYDDSRPEEVNYQISNSQKNKDYYTLLPYGSGQPWVVPIDRDISAPSRDTHFKIRIVNLCKYLPDLTSDYPSPNGPIEDLMGSISLVYADGTEVDAKTSHISVGQRTSEYVEVPYGTYQFKILTADGRQIPGGTYGVNENIIRFNTFDPPTSRINVHEDPVSTGLTYAPIKTYHPGGTYTIVVVPQFFGYYFAVKQSTYAVQNQFKIIEDHDSLPVHDYGKTQVINAFSDDNLSFRINGEVFTSDLAFGKSSDYKILKQGTYEVDVVDRNKQIIAKANYDMSVLQNHSIWLYPDDQGNPHLQLLVNDLSGEFYYDRFANDGTYNRYEHTMVFATRFVNFCPDIPYASFTIDNGQDMRNYAQLFANDKYLMHADEAMYKLRFAMPSTTLPYVRWRLDYNILYDLLVYRSTSDIRIGEWAYDIESLSSQRFIANPGLYNQVGRGLPTAEPGVYTIALVGRVGQQIRGDLHPKTILVKHNK